MTTVLIADDSILIRKRITQILETDNRLKVVGTASNGADTIARARELKPDVVTLDVEMPVMNGLEALEVLVNQLRIPVVMLSALTTRGAEVTMRALELGAVDFIAKPGFGNEKEAESFARELILKIRTASSTRPRSAVRNETTTASRLMRSGTSTAQRTIDSRICGVGIGISTGGPKTLMSFIPKIPGNFPAPIFIAQHMPEGFTSSLANRLDTVSNIDVREAKNGEIAKPGVCYIAPGGKHMKVMHMTLAKGVMMRISDEPETALFKPSADVLLASVGQVYGKNAIGIIMTGMGRDGTRGTKIIKEQGGTVISEDKSTCVVYGMPKSVEEEGLSDFITPSYEIPKTLAMLLKL